VKKKEEGKKKQISSFHLPFNWGGFGRGGREKGRLRGEKKKILPY